MEAKFSRALEIASHRDESFLKLVFVNYAHPDTPHISGVRLWRFAQELSTRGHQVVHITATLDGACGTDSGSVCALLEKHDWNQPLHIAVKPERRIFLDLVRENRLPKIVRKALTAYAMVVKGGVFYDWTDASKGLSREFGERFKPDLVWGTFGNSSNLHLAQEISRSGCSKLVLDFKDSITAFVPRGMRWWFTLKYRSASGISSNARALGDEAGRCLGASYKCIYSGVDSAFYGPSDGSNPQPERDQPIYFTLTGSIYSEEQTKNLLDIFSRWCGTKLLESNQEIRLKYMGGSCLQVRSLCNELAISHLVELHEYLPLDQLAAACKSKGTVANMYIKGSPFHHKLLELLTTGKPVICLGRESEESYELASKYRDALYTPETESDLVTSFDKALMTFVDSTDTPKRKADYSWPSMTKKLENYFLTIAQSN